MKAFTIASILALSAAVSAADKAPVTPLISKKVVSAPGQEAVMITVEYPPGYDGEIHRHNAQSFIYVLEGSVVMQVRGGEPATLKAGDTFYESPTDVHTVGRNASDTEAAKLLVFLIKDAGAPIVLPVQ